MVAEARLRAFSLSWLQPLPEGCVARLRAFTTFRTPGGSSRYTEKARERVSRHRGPPVNPDVNVGASIGAEKGREWPSSVLLLPRSPFRGTIAHLCAQWARTRMPTVSRVGNCQRPRGDRGGAWTAAHGSHQAGSCRGQSDPSRASDAVSRPNLSGEQRGPGTVLCGLSSRSGVARGQSMKDSPPMHVIGLRPTAPPPASKASAARSPCASLPRRATSTSIARLP